MIVSIIVAVTENNMIGRDNELIAYLSDDLKHFKKITTGHTVVMGRKTYESIGKALPNRRNVVLTRNVNYKAENCVVLSNVNDAISMCREDEEVFIIGGGSLYREMWNIADRLYITRIHTNIDGDTSIPKIDLNIWEEESREMHKANEKNEYDYSFINYIKKQIK